MYRHLSTDIPIIPTMVKPASTTFLPTLGFNQLVRLFRVKTLRNDSTTLLGYSFDRADLFIHCALHFDRVYIRHLDWRIDYDAQQHNQLIQSYSGLSLESPEDK